MVDKVHDKLLLAAFHNGVSLDLFIPKLYDQKPQTMAELPFNLKIHECRGCDHCQEEEEN